MSRQVGRSVSLSPFRRLVADLMYFCQQVPTVTVERRMNLARLLECRQRCRSRPSWCAIFAKAYALVAARHPPLRQSYMTFPWPRLYEHPYSIATLNVARQVNEEQIVIYLHIRRPETRSLSDLDTLVRNQQERPLETIAEYRRARRLSGLPGPLRRFVMWGALNVFGRRRCHNFGTFALTSVAAHGAGVHRTAVLTSAVHYMLFDAAGWLDMRLSFDHRVIDGALAARALVEMEEVLNSEICQEVRGLWLHAAA